MLEGGSSTDENMYWVLATMGEAAIIRGNFERAAKFYRRAVKRCVVVTWLAGMHVAPCVQAHLLCGFGAVPTRTTSC